MVISPFEQGSKEWKTERYGKLTGTRIKEIITPARLQLASGRDDVILKMIDENITGLSADRFYYNDDMKRGNDFEPQAKDYYTETTGIKLIDCGLCTKDNQPLHGCSPDGFTEDYKGAVEVKCPGGLNYLKYINPKYKKSIFTDYKIQCLNYFLVNEKLEWLDTIAFRPEFYPKPIHIERIYRKDIEKDLIKLQNALDEFFVEYEQEFNNYIF